MPSSSSVADCLNDWEQPPSGATPKWFQDRGRAFERIINHLLTKEGLEPRGSLRPSGEEIDGSFVLNHRAYLLEAKWRKDPIPASDLYAFKGKVDGKLIGTVGVFISMSGYSEEAIDALKFGKDINLILLGPSDFRLIWNEDVSFSHAMKLKLRYAAEEGQPYLPLSPQQTPATHAAGTWDVIVEGSHDETALGIVFHRLDPNAPVRIWTAGGQLGIPSLLRNLRSTGNARIAVLVESDVPPQLLDELRVEFKNSTNSLVVVHPNLEEWLWEACPADYLNAIPETGILNKRVRRYANHADLPQLLSAHPDFAALLHKIIGPHS